MSEKVHSIVKCWVEHCVCLFLMVVHVLKRPILVIPPTFVTIQSGIHNAATAKQSAMKNKVNEMADNLSIFCEKLHHFSLKR